MDLRCAACNAPLDAAEVRDDGSQTCRACHLALAGKTQAFSDPSVSYEVADERTTLQYLTPDVDVVRTARGRQPLPRIGAYELLSEIARGGMGVVYKARQVNLNRVVALKMILAGQLASDADVRRFQAEAAAAAMLDHPGIVPIFEVGSWRERQYFSMAYVAGENLASLVRKQPLAPRHAAELLLKITLAAAYAHSRGIIHRDLKPSNILIDEAGEPRITDFGLAKKLASDEYAGMEALTTTGQVLGTPSYMPPEQATGDLAAVSTASDIYALGAILYFLLTGKPPFQSANIVETLQQVIHQDPIPPRALDSSIPLDLQTICLKCLAKSPSDRYASANELAAELQRFLEDAPIVARPTSRAERLWRWVRRNPAKAGLVVASAGAVLAIIVTVLGLLYQRELEHSNTLLAQSNAQLKTTQDALQVSLAKQAQANNDRRRALYFRRVSSAYMSWRDGEVQRALQLLAECEPEFRGWEWGFVHRLCRTGERTIHVPNAFFNSIAFSPDGRLLACGHSDQFVRVFDAQTGQEQLELPIPGWAGARQCVAFSVDGKRLAAGNDDGTVWIWNVADGALVKKFKAHGKWVRTLAYSPDGRYLITGSDEQTINVWDAGTFQKQFSLVGHVGFVKELVVSTDSSWLVSCGKDRIIRAWDLKSREVVQTFPVTAERITCVGISPDGKQIASGDNLGVVTIWDRESGRPLFIVRHDAWVHDLDFSPDGNRLVTVGENQLARLWDATSGREVTELKSHTHSIYAVRFSPDGTRIASGSRELKIWNEADIQPHRVLKDYEDAVFCVDFSPSGRHLASADMHVERPLVTISDVESGESLLTFRGHTSRIRCLAYSPDGKRIASGGDDRQILVWSAETGEILLRFSKYTRHVRQLDFSPDGRYIASVGTDCPLYVWDSSTGQIQWQAQGDDSFRFAVFTPDGRQVAASDFHHITLFDRETGARIRSIPARVRSFAFSPDGRRIVASDIENRGNNVYVWDAAAGRKILQFAHHRDYFSDFCFTPDGKRIVGSGSDVTLWEAETGEEAITIKGHAGYVTSVAVSPDGKIIVSGGKDGTVRLWDARPR